LGWKTLTSNNAPCRLPQKPLAWMSALALSLQLDLQDIQVGSTVALQNPRTKLWDIYGTVVNISPHRRYSVKTYAGRVLVQNRRFLRFRSPASTITHDGGSPQLPTPTQPAGRVQNPILPQNSSLQGASIQHSQTLPPRAPRRSERTRRPPQRLIEDPQWP